MGQAANRGEIFAVVRQLPEVGGVPQYQIKSEIDGHARVVSETSSRICELSENLAARASEMLNPVRSLESESPSMAWRCSTRDPTTDPVAPKVIEAFERAQEAGLSMRDCYKAGVDVWRRAHPDRAVKYASQQAVEIILKAKISLRVEA